MKFCHCSGLVHFDNAFFFQSYQVHIITWYLYLYASEPTLTRTYLLTMLISLSLSPPPLFYDSPVSCNKKYACIPHIMKVFSQKGWKFKIGFYEYLYLHDYMLKGPSEMLSLRSGVPLLRTQRRKELLTVQIQTFLFPPVQIYQSHLWTPICPHFYKE